MQLACRIPIIYAPYARFFFSVGDPARIAKSIDDIIPGIRRHQTVQVSILDSSQRDKRLKLQNR
jgi:hypothetical protein